jgi:hypothetical protein
VDSFFLKSKRFTLIILYARGHTSLDLLWPDHENRNLGGIEDLLCDTYMQPAIYTLPSMGR